MNFYFIKMLYIMYVYIGCWVSRSVVSDSCDPVDCILPGSSIHGTLQARRLEWVAISFFTGSSLPGDRLSYQGN